MQPELLKKENGAVSDMVIDLWLYISGHGILTEEPVSTSQPTL